jgi:hypothetical protein
MIHQESMKPESKLSGFIGRHHIMAGISGQNAVRSFKSPGMLAEKNFRPKVRMVKCDLMHNAKGSQNHD